MATLMRCDSKKRARSLSLAVNIRKRLRLPDDVLGNLMGSLSLDCAADATSASLRAVMTCCPVRLTANARSLFLLELSCYARGRLRGPAAVAPADAENAR